MPKKQKEKKKEQEETYKGRVKRLQWRRFKTATLLTIIVGIIGGIMIYTAVLGLMQKIEPDNLCPIITSTPKVIAKNGENYTYQVKAEDPDGDTLRYDIEKIIYAPGQDIGDGFKIDKETGFVFWNVPKENPSTITYISIKVTDGKLIYTQSFYLTVGQNKSVPIINTSSKPSLVVKQNEQYRYAFKVIDNEGDVPTFNLNESSPYGIKINIGRTYKDKNSTEYDAYAFFKEEGGSKYVKVIIWVDDGNGLKYSYISYSVWVKPDVDVNVLYMLLFVGIILIAGVCYDFYRLYGY